MEYCRVNNMWFLRLSHKRYCIFYFSLSWITCCGESQPPCQEDTQAVLWSGPQEELRSCANSQHQLASRASSPSWKCILQSRPSHQKTWVSWEKRQTPPAHTRSIVALRLNLAVICYITKGEQGFTGGRGAGSHSILQFFQLKGKVYISTLEFGFSQ